MYGNECVSECLLPCRSCAQILDRGEGWVGRDLQHPRKRHQPPRVTRTQPGEVLNPGRTGLSWRLLERPLLSGNVAVMCRTHLQMFSVSTVLGEKVSDVVHSRGASAELPRPSPQRHTAQKRTTERRRHVW